jgi:hypothetical protein
MVLRLVLRTEGRGARAGYMRDACDLLVQHAVAPVRGWYVVFDARLVPGRFDVPIASTQVRASMARAPAARTAADSVSMS